MRIDEEFPRDANATLSIEGRIDKLRQLVFRVNGVAPNGPVQVEIVDRHVVVKLPLWAVRLERASDEEPPIRIVEAGPATVLGSRPTRRVVIADEVDEWPRVPRQS